MNGGLAGLGWALPSLISALAAAAAAALPTGCCDDDVVDKVDVTAFVDGKVFPLRLDLRSPFVPREGDAAYIPAVRGLGQNGDGDEDNR